MSVRLCVCVCAMVLHISTDVIVIWLQHSTAQHSTTFNSFTTYYEKIPSFHEMKRKGMNKNKTSAQIYLKYICFNRGQFTYTFLFLLLQIPQCLSRLHYISI